MSLSEWTTLFGSGGGHSTRTFRLLRRRGEPLLLLPQRAGAAVECLRMYPAQTTLARAARALASLAVRIPGMLWPPKIRLPWHDAAALPRFLKDLTADATLEFGALLGNPRSEGRRWILLLFENASPRRVVKVGASSRARALIAAEHLALAALPADLMGRPNGVQYSAVEEFSALAMDFVPGRPPPVLGVEFGELLGSWLDASARIHLDQSPIWQTVSATAGEAAARIQEAMGATPFRPAIFHGDFAPWNLRMSNAGWTAIDWERGEARGLPGWDWFHFIVQTRILVGKRTARETLTELELIFTGAVWQTYARKADIAGRERSLLAGYLLWADEVVRPSEGREALREMRALLSPA